MNIPYVFKKCSKCGEWLVANEINFYKRKNSKWGLRAECKKCFKKIKTDKYNNDEEYKEKIKKQKKEYYNKKIKDEKWVKKERERNRKRMKEKRQNEEYKIEENRRQREKYNNDEEYRKQVRKVKNEQQKNRYNNDEEYRRRANESSKKWQKNNPHKMFNIRNKRRNKIENQGRGITDEQYKECNNWFEWKCSYSGENLKNHNNSTYGRTLDHIVALDNGGLNEPWNIVPMRKGYNSSKNNNKSSLNWYMEQEYFDEERLNKIVEWQIYAYEKWGGEEFGELILITDLKK